MTDKISWTNPSVKLLAKDQDPVDVVVGKTRELIFDAIDGGWKGPPYDPVSLAKNLGFDVIPNEDVLDARVISKGTNVQIEYNPNKSKTRIRFSLAHEIAHTLFPDYKESIRNRSKQHSRPDGWQLELLCNIAASEILIPVVPPSNLGHLVITMNNLIEIKKRYDVSMESVLLRMIKLTTQPITFFSAARKIDDKNSSFRIDYVINSKTSLLNIKSGMEIPSDSVLSECSAIGFTAQRKEKWFKELPSLDIECVGVSPYPTNVCPRVIGIIKTKSKKNTEPLRIQYLVGDATEPHGNGGKMIVHIVNDQSKRWGRGFGLNISKKWPKLGTNFVKWANLDSLTLGTCHIFNASNNLVIISMITQHGYGKSKKPRIRYSSLATCLEIVAIEAKKESANVHMPRIGTGYAGGDWKIISEMVDDLLIKRGIEVTVYDLPETQRPRENYNLLDFSSPELLC